MLSVSPPDFFSQTWRAPTWPEGHYGTLKVSLEQGSGSTKLSLDLEGVPVGKEEETEKGLEIYYIRSLKVRLQQYTKIMRVQMLIAIGSSFDYSHIQQIGSVLANESSPSILHNKSPYHPWALPGYTPWTQRDRAKFLLTATASVFASVFIPAGMIALFGWLLYRGPTFQQAS